MWTTVKQARQHGFNVRKSDIGWQIGRLSRDGYTYSPYGLSNRTTALQYAYWEWEDKTRRGD